VLAALAAPLILAGAAQAGSGEGFFYAKGPKVIPDGHGVAKLHFQTTLPNDVDPTVDYVSVSLRVSHPQTHDLIVSLQRPNFADTGGQNQSLPTVVTLSDRSTHGKNLGRGGCPDSNPGFAPAGFTTLNDLGGPPPPMSPSPTPPLSTGSPPYAGVFAPAEPLSGFQGYHAAPATNPASPETWTLSVKDVRPKHSGKLLCAELYLHRV